MLWTLDAFRLRGAHIARARLGLVVVLRTLHSQTPPEATFPERRIQTLFRFRLWFDAGDIALGLALASPSTLNTPLHTLSSELYGIASAAVNQQPEDPGPRVVGAKLIKRAARESRSREGVILRGSSTHHHRHQRVLRLERALDPRGPPL